MNWLKKHEAQRAEKSYEEQFASWQSKHNNIQSCIELAKNFHGVPTDDVMLKPGEALFLQVTGASLIEERLGPGHWQGRSSGVSIPVAHIGHSAIRYHVGASKGYFVQGSPYDASVDTGTAFITNKRVIFAGAHQTRECSFDKLLSYQNDDSIGSTTFSVSNRQKPTTIHYGMATAPAFVFRLTLALANYKGAVPAFIKQLELTRSRLESNKPALPLLPPGPAGAIESESKNAPHNSPSPSKPVSNKPKKTKTNWLASKKLIIGLLIFVWPVGLFLLCRHSNWRTRNRLVATSLSIVWVLALLIALAVNSPPTLAITSSLDDQTSGNYTLTGNVDVGDILTVNGKIVTVQNGNFSINESLNKGDNTFTLVAKQGSKVTQQEIVIHRYTDSELAAQKSAAQPQPSPEHQAPTQSTPKPASAPMPQGSQLTFSGAISGIVSGDINVLPKLSSSSFDTNSTDWSTQCIMAPSSDNGGAWTANVAFKMNGTTWSIQISNSNNFGNPSPGKHDAVDQQNNRQNTGALLASVESKQPVFQNQFASDTDRYAYVTTGAGDNTNATVTINPGLTSGTLDLWEVPFNSYVPNQNFHITGTWDCSK